MSAFEGGRDFDLDEPIPAVVWLRETVCLGLMAFNSVAWPVFLYVVLS